MFDKFITHSIVISTVLALGLVCILTSSILGYGLLLSIEVSLCIILALNLYFLVVQKELYALIPILVCILPFLLLGIALLFSLSVKLNPFAF